MAIGDFWSDDRLAVNRWRLKQSHGQTWKIFSCLPQEICLVNVFLRKGTKQHIDVVVLILDPWMFCLEF